MKPDARLRFVADVPDLSAANWPDGAPEDVPAEQTPPTSRIQIAKVGNFKHRRYGNFRITLDTFRSFIANFDAGIPTAEIAIDPDHASEVEGDTRAVGWYKRLHIIGDGLFADVEWTWRGAYMIREGEYKYFSPSWNLNHQSDDGAKHGPTILGGGLTNRPFFERMATVSLSRALNDAADRGVFAFCEIAEEASSDSRPAMELTTFAQLFGLAADATEDQVLEAAKAAAGNGGAAQFAQVLGLKEDATGEDIMTAAKELVEKAAKAPGEDQVVVASTQLAQLTTQAAAGAGAAKDLADMKFNTAFDAALAKGTVAPAEKDGLKTFYDLNPEATLEQIAARQPIVNTRPAGSPANPGETPDGYDADSVALDREVRKFMVENDVEDYSVALSRVLEQKEMAL